MAHAEEHESRDGHQASAWRALGPVMDLVTPMAVRVAATLGLADIIAEDGTSAEELGEASGSDPDAVARLLRHLVRHGVFAEPEPGSFAMNKTAALLRSDHPAQMRTWLDLEAFGGQMDLAFTELLNTVRTGRPAWERVFGAPFWSYLATNPAMRASFDATMAAGHDYVHDAAGGYDWSELRHVVDVGGGTGALLTEILDGHPDVRATLVDLPDTVARGQQHLEERGLAERCDFVGQSFFDPLPAGADAYVLSGVIHDWGDDEATAILRRCSEAASGGGRVLVVESHGTSGDDPGSFAEMNLRMLVLCGGRERNLEDYGVLANAAGLQVAEVRNTPLGHVILECVPTPSSRDRAKLV